MEKIVSSFLELLKEFQNKPISFIILLLVLVSAYFIYNQSETLSRLIPDPQREGDIFSQSLQRDQQVNQAMEQAKSDLSSDLVGIAQFHNGQYDLTGLPFTKITVTYSTTGEALGPIRVYDTRPLSSMNNIMMEMWRDKSNPVCVMRETSSLRDSAYKDRVEATGLEFISLCPLSNIRDYPIGVLGVGYSRNLTPLEKDRLKLYQRAMAFRISGYLQQGII